MSLHFGGFFAKPTYVHSQSSYSINDDYHYYCYYYYILGSDYLRWSPGLQKSNEVKFFKSAPDDPDKGFRDTHKQQSNNDNEK